MGGCLSKKRLPSTPKEEDNEKDFEKKKPVSSSQHAQPSAAEKKPVFVVNQTKKTPIATVHKEKDEKKGETPIKRMQKDGERFGIEVAVATEDRAVSVPVRTSSCSKEELDAILIQCGRLSRSSSGKAANEASVVRRYSGSKRSYDFDEERRRGDEEDWDKPVSRPSPRRRTPSRERDGGGECKRSGSRERGNGDGKRRVSRSPGRRSDGPASSNSVGDRLKPPAKMVSVPAREKDGAVAAETGRNVVKRPSSPAMSKLRSQSPRSRSPANTRPLNENSQHSSNYPQPQSLSRSSSRKAEQSPYRRSPMAELDENSLKAEQNPSRRTGRSQSQKASEGVAQARKPEPRNSGSGEISSGVKSSNTITNCVREQLLSCRAPAKPPTSEIEEEVPEVEGTMKAKEIGLNPISITRTRSSRRSSRDLDNWYNSLLLEDIHNYHQNGTIVSLPACVSKACSILEAVADLNTSSSDNKSHEGEGYSNASNSSHNGTTLVRDDFVPPGLHKYVTIRRWEKEMEPQESAGSNSFAGQPWASPWEPNSVESSDRCWSSRSNTTREESAHEEEQAVPDAPGGRVRGGSCTGSLPAAATPSGKKREFDHVHGSGIVAAGNGKDNSRAYSASS